MAHRNKRLLRKTVKGILNAWEHKMDLKKTDLTYNMKPKGVEDNYTMTLKAYPMPTFGQNIELFNNDADSGDIFLTSFGEMILSGATELAEGAVDFVSEGIKDGVNALKKGELDIGFNVASAFTSLKNTITDAIGALAEYTDGANPNKGELMGTFVFPVPNNLTDTLRHAYDQDTFSPLEKMVGVGSKLAKRVIGGEGASRMMDATIAFNVEQAKRNNYVFDNNLINIYKNTEQREFIFNITIIPQSYDEFKNILQGYSYLKVLMTGEQISMNMALAQKCSFTVSFKNENLTTYMHLDDTIDLNLETLEIDVSGNPFTSYATESVMTGTGVPKLIQIIMTLRERRPLRNNMIKRPTEPQTTSTSTKPQEMTLEEAQSAQDKKLGF